MEGGRHAISVVFVLPGNKTSLIPFIQHYQSVIVPSLYKEKEFTHSALKGFEGIPATTIYKLNPERER